MINITINNHKIKVKADTGAEANVIPFSLYRQITWKPLQKIHQPLRGWLAAKTIHPAGCVRLSTQYKNRTIDLLYLVVHGDFTPLMSCNSCLDLKVLQFMNLDLIQCKPTVPNTQESKHTFPDIITTDPVLMHFQDCFSDKPGRLPHEITLEIDETITPVIH